MPVKGQGTINRQIAKMLAHINRQAFLKNIQKNLPAIYNTVKQLKVFSVPLVSFSSKHDMAEQVLSILSFVKHCGEPKNWIIYSDGTHTTEDALLLTSNFSFVEVKYLPFDDISQLPLKLPLQPYKSSLTEYAIKHPLGKKLLCFLNHPVNEPTIFLDSDIVFYEKSTKLESIKDHLHTGAFLPDNNWGTLDEKYLMQNSWQLYSTNSGFFWVCNEIKIEKGLEHLQSVKGSYNHFSEQTTFHIIFKENKFLPLDPRLFFVSVSDQFKLGYNFKKKDLILRHYTNPVRYKMWQRNWKWHLL